MMQNFINVLIIFAVGMVPLFILTWVAIFIRKRNVSSRKNPINTHLLRGPGQSLLEKAEDLSIDIFTYLLMTPFICLLLYFIYITTNKTLTSMVTFLMLFAASILFLGIKIVTLTLKREKFRLGLDAELAVGQELNLLMRDGFYVFHDVNLKNTISEFNIDHIVIGKSGIFAVETKGRSKQISKAGKHEFKVTFDGQKLTFPQREEKDPVDQAKRQANSLQKWLSSAIGEPTQVQPVIALPGWFITTNKKSSVAVINGKNPEKYFNMLNGPELSPKQIKQIAHQLESLCRNVEPKAFSVPK